MSGRANGAPTRAAISFAAIALSPASAHASDFSGLPALLYAPVLAVGLVALYLLAFLGDAPGVERRFWIAILASSLLLCALPIGVCAGGGGEVPVLYWGLVGGIVLVVIAALLRGAGVFARRPRDAVEPEFGPDEIPAAFRVESLAWRERHDRAEPYRHAQGFDRDLDLVWPWRGTRAVGRAHDDVVMAGLYTAGSLVTYGMWPFALLAALGACHALRAVAHRSNRTTIRVRGGTLTITHGPLALPTRVELTASDIEGFGTLERAPFDANQATFAVVARRVGGRKVTLVTGLPTARHAEWLAREMSESMGVK